MDSFHKLADLFRQFPGIGPRQAKRFVYFLLSREPEFAEKLSELVSALKKEIKQCKECFRFFHPGSRAKLTTGQGKLCSICADPNRDTGELMVVAKDTDLEAMEKSGVYHGRYFVLGGTRALMERKNADKLRLKELEAFVAGRLHPPPSASSHLRASAPLKEVIVALSANPDGEHTTDALRTLLAPYKIKITTLGRGLSTGSELEYADSETLTSALKNRSPFRGAD